MDKRSIKLNGVLYTVATVPEWVQAPFFYNPEFTVLLFDNLTNCYGFPNQPFILPFRKPSERAKGLPGIYGYSFDNKNGAPMFDLIYPFYVDNITDAVYVMAGYSTATMIDASNIQSIQELIDLSNKYHETEFSIITAGNDITSFVIRPTDTAALAALKEALNSKHINIDNYKARFGITFANDKRGIEKFSDITLNKLKSACEATDIAVSMTFYNASPDVPNPMDHPITTILTNNVNKQSSNSSDEKKSVDENEEEEDMYGD